MYTFSESWEEIRKNRMAYFYILPAFTVMGIVVIYPFIYNVMLSFSNMSLMHFKDWSFVGLRQYERVFSDPIFYSTLWKTVLWTTINLFFHVVIGVSLALLLNRPILGRAWFRTLLIIPWAVPQYISALTWRGMFNFRFGSINLILIELKPIFEFFNNIPGVDISMPPYNWLSDPTGAFAAAIIANIWLGFPFMMIVALGGLQSIPNVLYEAADVDGATAYQKFRNITYPLLKPVMIPAISLGMIWTFNNFNVIWLVTNGGRPSDSSHILVSYVYKAVFNQYRYGYSAALSMVIFMILLIVGVNFIRRSRATKGAY